MTEQEKLSKTICNVVEKWSNDREKIKLLWDKEVLKKVIKENKNKIIQQPSFLESKEIELEIIKTQKQIKKENRSWEEGLLPKTGSYMTKDYIKWLKKRKKYNKPYDKWGINRHK